MSDNVAESNVELKNALLAAFGADALDWFDDDQAITAFTQDANAPVTGESPVGIDLAAALEQLAGTDGLVDILGVFETDDTNARKQLEKSARYVIFEVGRQRFAIPLEGVEEIERCGKITALPRTPEWLRGITNLRGTIFSVTDFRKLLKLDDESSVPTEKFIVVQSKRLGTRTALVVDRILGIRHLDALPDSTHMLSRNVAAYASGVAALDAASVVLIQPDLLLGCNDLRSISDS